jgi:hypothetical protein
VTKPVHETIAQEVIIRLARLRKGELIDAGKRPGAADEQAAEEAAERLRAHGIMLGVSTIQRRMQTVR